MIKPAAAVMHITSAAHEVRQLAKQSSLPTMCCYQWLMTVRAKTAPTPATIVAAVHYSKQRTAHHCDITKRMMQTWNLLWTLCYNKAAPLLFKKLCWNPCTWI